MNSGLFPSIKDYRTINKQIDGIITTGNKKEYCSVFTAEEEETIVWECVTVHPFVSFSGYVAMCHIIFKGKGISQQMAPLEAVTNTPHLLISANDSGSQDHITLLAAYKEFDSYLEEKGIEKPVVVLSDGHASRFDADVFSYLRNAKQRLYIGPTDTTGVT